MVFPAYRRDGRVKPPTPWAGGVPVSVQRYPSGAEKTRTKAIVSLSRRSRDVVTAQIYKIIIIIYFIILSVVIRINIIVQYKLPTARELSNNIIVYAMTSTAM